MIFGMNDLLKKMMGVRDPEPSLRGEKCAWRYYAEECIQNDVQVPDRHAKCEYCNGYPIEGCMSYTTLSHLEQFYDMFQSSRQPDAEG